MNFSKLKNLFKLKCAWLGNFILGKREVGKGLSFFIPFKN